MEKKLPTDDVMTLEQLARYLRVPVKTFYRAGIEKMGLPGFKIGKSWYFKKSDLKKWIADQKK